MLKLDLLRILKGIFMEYHGKSTERRSANGIMKPMAFLMFEVIVLASLIYFIYLLDILIITILSALGAIFFFITSSLVRYRRVRKRQKYNHH